MVLQLTSAVRLSLTKRNDHQWHQVVLRVLLGQTRRPGSQSDYHHHTLLHTGLTPPTLLSPMCYCLYRILAIQSVVLKRNVTTVGILAVKRQAAEGRGPNLIVQRFNWLHRRQSVSVVSSADQERGKGCWLTLCKRACSTSSTA